MSEKRIHVPKYVLLRNEALDMWQQEVAVAVAVASRVAVAAAEEEEASIADAMEIAMGLLFVASLDCTNMVVQPL